MIANLNQAGPRSGRQWRRARHQHGLSLIEFLIAITLGLMIVAALTLLIAQQSATQAEFEKSSRQIENGRYATQILNDDVQLAGFYGELSTVGAAPGVLPDPCVTTLVGLEAAMPFAVQGYDFDSSSAPAGLGTCIHIADHKPDTDILVIRRADAASVAVGSAVAGQVYLQSGLDPVRDLKRVMGSGSDTSVFTYKNNALTATAPIRKFRVHVYFISPCSVPSGANCNASADGGKPIPTLKMLELTAAGGATAITTTPLVEGIENMQIDYGIDSDGDGSPDGQFVSTVAALADWANVMALRVHLLARNTESSPGYSDAKTYSLGYLASASAQQVTVSTDAYGNNVRPFKRRVFSQMIRLVNPSGRLDK